MLEGNKKKSEYSDPNNRPTEWYDFGGNNYVVDIESKITIALNSVRDGKYYFKSFEVEGKLDGPTLTGISEELEKSLVKDFENDLTAV